MATSLILIHENTQPNLVDHFDVLVDPRSSHVPSTSSKRQLTLPNVMLYLPQFLILLSQLLLVDPVAFDLGHHALVLEVVHGAVDFGAEVMVVLEEFELTRGVGVKGSGRWEWGSLEGLDILMRVPVNHTIYEGVFAILKLDVLGRFHFIAGEMDVEGDVVCAFIPCVPLWDLRSWSIIFPSKPQVSLLPFVGWSISAISSW